MYIAEKRWYYRLVPQHQQGRAKPLMADHPLESLRNHLVVYATFESGKMYALFDSYAELFQYQLKFIPEKRCFYEVLFGEFPQKPHFDIDIADIPIDQLDDVAISTFNSTIQSINDTLQEKGVSIDLATNMLVFSSHTALKRSFHLVIDGFYHLDNNEAQAFYLAVLSRIPQDLKQFVDASVYKSRQQFRLLGSHKINKNNTKIFISEWEFNDQMICHPDCSKLELFAKSIVSFCSDSVSLPNWVVQKLYQQVSQELTEDMIQASLTLMTQVIDSSPFSLGDVSQNMIGLKRKYPSLCPMCQRVHEHENPFIVVNGGKAYWNCRRNAKSLLLGYVGMMSVEDIINGDQPDSLMCVSGGLSSDNNEPQGHFTFLSQGDETDQVSLQQRMEEARRATQVSLQETLSRGSNTKKERKPKMGLQQLMAYQP